MPFKNCRIVSSLSPLNRRASFDFHLPETDGPHDILSDNVALLNMAVDTIV